MGAAVSRKCFRSNWDFEVNLIIDLRKKFPLWKKISFFLHHWAIWSQPIFRWFLDIFYPNWTISKRLLNISLPNRCISTGVYRWCETKVWTNYMACVCVCVCALAFGWWQCKHNGYKTWFRNNNNYTNSNNDCVRFDHIYFNTNIKCLNLNAIWSLNAK